MTFSFVIINKVQCVGVLGWWPNNRNSSSNLSGSSKS